MRIVLDTNVIVSAIAYPNSLPGGIWTGVQQFRWELALSHYILDEVTRVLPRLLRLRLTEQHIQELIESTTETLMFLAQMVELPETNKTVEPRLRDRNDQPVLQTLLVSRADCLVTGDKDLLALSSYYPILTPAEFLQRYAI